MPSESLITGGVGESRPNKPMVPTATASTEEPSTQLVRQHIGEPFGSRNGGGRRAASDDTRTERPQHRRQNREEPLPKQAVAPAGRCLLDTPYRRR